ncbi:MAG TPA: MaoC family dehydratase N-terminal domain-containing protein [Burkholderiales bacterium]|nr:MaoC family dehydratase N-terminal domain-containing protein [Burkholderiales bacterium]
MAQDELEQLKQWVGRKEGGVDYVTIPLVERLAATLDLDLPPPKEGDALPIGWYTVLFPRVVPHSQIGPDGHPRRGDFLPPVPLPRRMFAGKRTTFHAPLRVGDKVTRESEISAVNIKDGRTGRMVFVTVRHLMSGSEGLAVTEEQDIVYRAEPDPNAPPPPPQAPPGKAVWLRKLRCDPVLLFRYSALTFNGHRIHYDYPYVTRQEGYPNLVMNGGLTTLLVYELARAHAPRPLRKVSSRNVRPLFVDDEFSFCGEPAADGSGAKLWATDGSGALALTAQAEY